MPTDRASRTAVLICQGRAAADGRLAIDRFSDPVAVRLLRGDELRPVRQVREGEAPGTARERMEVELVGGCAEGIVPRTVAIDDAIRTAGHRQVVLVGAGLDTRPWRLADLAGAAVFAVDHPASQADARVRSAGLVPVAGRLVLVPVDLGADDLGASLERAGHDASSSTTWVWEGVVPYLTPAEVGATLRAVAGRSAPGSVVVVNYQARSWAVSAGRRLSGLVARITGYDHPLAGEPWRSTWTPDGIRRLMARCGFTVRTDEDHLAVARRLGMPVRRPPALRNGRVAVADR